MYLSSHQDLFPFNTSWVPFLLEEKYRKSKIKRKKHFIQFVPPLVTEGQRFTLVTASVGTLLYFLKYVVYLNHIFVLLYKAE